MFSYANTQKNDPCFSSQPFSIRTDLALESQERITKSNLEISGVVLTESFDAACNATTTTVVIESENGAKAMGKPKGTYLTLESPNLAFADADYHHQLSVKLSELLKSIMPIDLRHACSVLIVGLGNRMITADSLGPAVADHLSITRHFIREYGPEASGAAISHEISSIAPGVMAQTGMETYEILKGIVEQTNPDLVIAIDALAARNTKRLNRTIQIADTGIHPGSGVGNHRHGLTKESLGIPVIGIGIPTVVEAYGIIHDAQGDASLVPHLNGMYVTPKDIDESVNRLSYTISEAINRTFAV